MVIAEPRLDFDAILPAADALDAIEQVVTALGLIEERMVDCCLDPEEILEDLERDPPTFLRGMPSIIERLQNGVQSELLILI